MTSITVVIPTRDRAAILAETLKAVASVDVPQSWEVELVVVDNGSLDKSVDVATRGRLGTADAQVLAQPERGVAKSRNAGARVTRSHVIAFLDDDVHPPTDWLIQIATPILRGEVAATVTSFRAAPGIDLSWMSREERGALITEESIDPAHPWLASGSMAIARKAFEACGGFEEELGPGALGAGGEDLLLTQQLFARGERIMVVPVVVDHYIDLTKLNREALAARAAAGMRSEAWIAYHWFGRDARLSLIKAPILKFLGRTREFAWHDQMRIESRRPRRFGHHQAIRDAPKSAPRAG